ncbi:MAG: hypothetical protein ACSW8G_07475 [Bacillota bacterium]
MKCGVKFCGGCNPHYQRGDAFRRIQSDLPEIEFEYAEEGTDYDHLLVIGGCTACCPIIEQYTVNGDVLKMWSEDHVGSIEEKLEEKLK